MGKDDKLNDIDPTHFAVRKIDRGDQGTLNRIYEALDEPARSKLLRYAFELREGWHVVPHPS